MTVDIRPKDTAAAISDLSKRLYKVEQKSSSPVATPGSGGIGDDPVVNTITIDGIVVGSTASPATNLVLSTGAFMEDIWIDADWDAPSDGTAASYDVELSRKVGFTYELVNNFRTSGTSIRMPGLEPSQTYGVRVVAINRIDARSAPLPSTGFSDISTGLDATVPAQVSNLQLTSGIRTIMATWIEVSDRDVARGTGTYQVQLATDSGFATLFADKFTSATVTSFSGVSTGTTYWGRVRAIDNSGNAGAWSTSVSTTPGGAASGDIGSGQVATVNIANLAVTNGKIADLAVDDAKIASLTADKITAGTLDADRIAANSIDVNKLTTSTLSAKTITLGSGGTLKIGSAPTTGILINDQGIRLYSGGTVKVAFDVAGTASFEGNISASTITSSTLTSATINSGTITGTTVRTAASGQRVAMEAGTIDSIRMYSGHASESSSGQLAVAVGGSTLVCNLISPRSSGNDYTLLSVSSVTGGNGSTIGIAIVNGSGTQRANFALTSASNGSTPYLIATGISEFYLPFSGGTTNADIKLKGSGDYSFVYFYGGGQESTINVNIGLGAGIHIMNGTNATFTPVQASAFNVASARSLKTNIRKETASALDKLGAMQVVRFNRTHEEDLSKAPPHIIREMTIDEIGFIADDLMALTPEAVMTDADGKPRSINLSVLLALTIKGIQELKEMVVLKRNG